MFYKLSNKIVKDNVVSTDLSILIYSRHIATRLSAGRQYTDLLVELEDSVALV